tara:strand:+ start:1970 stop:3223 length:1254 start_codon:yes stop_codon:yes gene_type:complete
MEATYHLTGEYPAWWDGKRFNTPIDMWAASDTGESTRNILQVTYLGGLKEEQFGTGTIPKDCLIKGRNGMKWEASRRQGVADAIDTLSVRHKSGGVSTLQFKSYDQGRNKFQGAKLHIIHLDEEPPFEIYEECVVRMATTRGHMLLTMTPLSGMTDTVLNYITDRDEGTSLRGKAFVQASWTDADHLSAEDVHDLEESIPAHTKEARSKGIPSVGEGRVYPIADSQISVPRFKIPDYYEHIYGLDFGWQDPTAAVFIARDPDTDTSYIYNTYKLAEQTPVSHANNLLQLGSDQIMGVSDPFGGTQRGQSDGVQMIERYLNAGLDIVSAERTFKQNGIATVLELMLSGKLKVFEDLSDWWGEFRIYGYDKKGKPNDKHDHLMDAMRYGIESGLELSKPKRSSHKMIFNKRQTMSPWAV